MRKRTFWRSASSSGSLARRTGCWSLYPYVDNNPATLVDPLGLQAWSSNWTDWGVPPAAGFYVCCFQQQISVCRGPAYTKLTSPRVKMCALQHEYIHVPRFREDCRYKNYCSGKPDGYPVYYKSEEHQNTMECEAWKATADCYQGEWGTYPQKKVKEYCGGL
jgi:hypothetical protein